MKTLRLANDVTPYPLENTLICLGTRENMYCNRDIYKGSWFVYCLTFVLMRESYKKSLSEMLPLVGKNLDRYFLLLNICSQAKMFFSLV